MRPSIIVVGSSNTDMILRVGHIPRPGETLSGEEFMMAAGGKGANQAVAAARAGGAVTLVAKLGADMFGDAALAQFKREGVDIHHVSQVKDVATGVALIFVNARGENSIGIAPGANAMLSPDDIDAAQESIASADVMLLQFETPVETVEYAAEIAAASGTLVILDPAPARTISPRLYRNSTLLTPNECEAEFLTGIAIRSPADAATAAKILRDRGAGGVAISLGERGVYFDCAGFNGIAPAFDVAAVDTTAAGDVFNGALAVAMAEKQDLQDAARFANAAAAIAVTRVGAQPSIPRRLEIDDFRMER